MFRQYFQWLRTCRGLSIWAVAFSGVAAIAEGAALGVLMPILDLFSGATRSQAITAILGLVGLEPDGRKLLLWCLGIFVFLSVLSAATRGAAEIVGLWLKAQIETKLRWQMTDALLNTAWSHFVKLRQGDISKAMVLEGMQIGTGAMHLISAIGAAVAALCYLVVSFAISVDLTLIALTFGFVGGLIYIAAARGLRRHADRLSQLVSDIGDRSAELFGNLKYFRATGREDALRARSVHLFKTYGDAYLKSQLFNPALRSGIELLAAVFIAGFLYYHLGHKGRPVSEILIFLAVFYRMVPRILAAQSFLFQARTHWTWLDTYEQRLRHILAHQLPPAGSALPVFERRLEIANVGFSYPGEARTVLDGISLAVPKGACIALVGPSGGGKTTVADLLTGLLRPTSGQVLVDGIDLNELEPVAWRHGVGLVMQEPLILHATIAENVALGDEHIDRDRVRHALDIAHAWEFVSLLPHGIDTVVAEKGARLSGGQRQRLSIARALYHQPRLLILDEATSALDGESEAKVQEAIDHMKGSITMLIVAHRLKTVRIADVIVVLGAGRIVESGSWDELMARRGAFHEMARLQGLQ